MTLPKGLAETIAAFCRGCDAKNKRVSQEVGPKIIERFHDSYREHEATWGDVETQMLTIARIAGRLGAVYAELDREFTVAWIHARFALRDAKAECLAGLGPLGKHCKDVDLETP